MVANKRSKNNIKSTKAGGDNGRIDFRPGVPETLFKKAGGRCSVPRCKNPTMGPFFQRDDAVNMGVACHIYSASENGPRGRGGKDPEFIRSENNGIWCCEYHSPLIDKANGCDYPADVLFAWKALAEARTLKQMNDIPSPLGWVESIEFTQFPGLKQLPKIMLSRRTLMTGRNCCGKSSLMQAAASITHSKYADRFSGAKYGILQSESFCAKIIYSTVDALSKEILLEINGLEIARSEGVIPYLLPPGDIEVIYCSEADRRKLDHEDDVDYLMRALNVDKSALFALAKIGSGPLLPGKITFERAMLYDDETEVETPRSKQDGDAYYELRFKKRGSQGEPLPFVNLSTSEQGRIIIDLLIIKAREVSKQRLTILLIENLSINFDEINFELLLRVLSMEDFQIVVLLPPAREKDILDKTQEKPMLKELDYLKFWQLFVVGVES